MSEIDLEQGAAAYGSYHRRSLGGSDVSVYYSDGEDVTSCYSYFYSTTGGSYEYEGGDDSRKVSSVMTPSSEIDDDDDDDDDATAPPEKDCRICHLGVETSGGGAIELGCSCKDDLAVAHKQCAETWFKIKGDKICEICQSVARNVGGANEMVMLTMDERELRNGGGGEDTAAVGGGGGATTAVENRWQPQRLVNIVLACMVFGFFVSWLFHFHVSSSS